MWLIVDSSWIVQKVMIYVWRQFLESFCELWFLCGDGSCIEGGAKQSPGEHMFLQWWHWPPVTRQVLKASTSTGQQVSFSDQGSHCGLWSRFRGNCDGFTNVIVRCLSSFFVFVLIVQPLQPLAGYAVVFLPAQPQCCHLLAEYQIIKVKVNVRYLLLCFLHESDFWPETISEVVTDWNELMILQCTAAISHPLSAPANKWTRSLQITDIPPP